MTGFVPDHAGAEVRVSPNFGVRRNGAAPDLIILHYTGMETGPAAESWLCNPESEVSSHYLVHEDGRIVQMVREADRAWHAGRSSWHGDTDVNSRSIGIEIVNGGHPFGLPCFPEAQIDAVVALCKGMTQRWNIAPQHVLAHSDVAPGRKVDPGERFPWDILHRHGVGHLAGPIPLDGAALQISDKGEGVEQLQSMLALYGYGIEISGFYDDATRIVVEAFQRHFRRTLVNGIADAETRGVLAQLLSTLAAQR